MSANARSWFYSEPESDPYLISERLNGTFWQARIVSIYWRCLRAEPPLRAVGYSGQHQLELEWVPGQWASLKAPADFDLMGLAEQITRGVLAMPAALTYRDAEGRQVVEWHADGGRRRWSEIQGRAGFVNPRRLGR